MNDKEPDSPQARHPHCVHGLSEAVIQISVTRTMAKLESNLKKPFYGISIHVPCPYTSHLKGTKEGT